MEELCTKSDNNGRTDGTEVRELKNGKSPGVHNIPTEILKQIGEIKYIQLYNLICEVYETGRVPTDFERNTMISIPKERKVARYENHRTLIIVVHA